MGCFLNEKATKGDEGFADGIPNEESRRRKKV